jgi:hypothetical protein
MQIANIVSNREYIYTPWVKNENKECKLTKLRKYESSMMNKELLM